MTYGHENKSTFESFFEINQAISVVSRTFRNANEQQAYVEDVVYFIEE